MKPITLLCLLSSVFVLMPDAAADTLQMVVLSTTQPSSTSCVAPPQQTHFVAGGGNIYEYFVVLNMKTGDTVSARWINPYSQVVMTTNWTHPLSNPGNYCWTGAFLLPYQYSYSPGTWNIQVIVNGQYLGQTPFTVTPTWQSMSQQQRNQAIINAGLNGHTYSQGTASQSLYYSGLQCKPWVTSVVSTASSGAVSLPATASDGYQWNSSPHVMTMSSNLQALQPGWILQLEESASFIARNKSATGPHTAIVLSVSPTGIYLLDSNWVATNTVGVHFMTWADLKNDFVYYTVYQIV